MAQSGGSGGGTPPSSSGGGAGASQGGDVDITVNGSPVGNDSDQQMAEGEDTLSDSLVRKWDPERLLKSVSRRAGKGSRLDETTRAKYERQMGADLSGVRVYSGQFAQEITRAHNAEALTIGNTGMILMGGLAQHSMADSSGRALLAHELTHVAQGQRGVFRSASFGDAAPLATEEHEAEAEAAAARERGEPPPSPGDADQKADKKKERVMARVLEKIADHQRVHGMRNGPDGWRP